jgi:AraC-like DNA-binding protein
VPHARAHLSALDLRDTVPMEEDAREALELFERARTVARRARYDFAAWYVAGNIERLQIVLGHASEAVRAIRKRLRVLQARGARYDEIVTRSNLAWGLRTMGCYREALHELDVASKLARETGTFNVLLEFLEYDRSIVLDALGDAAAARASYRRYLQLVGAIDRARATEQSDSRPETPRRPLEPFYLKRADRFILDHIAEPFTVAQLAAHCGVSWRSLGAAFVGFRGMTPVAYVRNLRLDQARRALQQDGGSVAEVSARCGFRSSTTFALEYRKRFGMAPSRARHSVGS